MVHYKQDAVNQQGATCLHVAAREGQLATVQWLVQVARASVQAVDRTGRTPLHVAAQRCQTQVLTWLVKHGGANANALSIRGGTPLHEAAASGGKELIEYLLEQKIDPSIKSKDGVTALDIAKEYENKDAIAILSKL